MTISKEAKAAYDKRYYQLNRGSKDDFTKLFNEVNPEKRASYIKIYRERIKRAALDHYGHQCACCGEGTMEFLSIDHINGGGTAHRKIMKGASIYAWLKRTNYPEGFRVLCFNCNLSLGFFGYCPHQRSVANFQAAKFL